MGKDIEIIKRTSQMKNKLEEINSWLDEAEEQDLRRVEKNTQSQQKEF